jgi:hypothetical protein
LGLHIVIEEHKESRASGQRPRVPSPSCPKVMLGHEPNLASVFSGPLDHASSVVPRTIVYDNDLVLFLEILRSPRRQKARQKGGAIACGYDDAGYRRAGDVTHVLFGRGFANPLGEALWARLPSARRRSNSSDRLLFQVLGGVADRLGPEITHGG